MDFIKSKFRQFKVQSKNGMINNRGEQDRSKSRVDRLKPTEPKTVGQDIVLVGWSRFEGWENRLWSVENFKLVKRPDQLTNHKCIYPYI